MNIIELYRRTAGGVRARADANAGKREPTPEEWVRDEIRAVCDQMDQAEQVFNSSTDPDLIDSSIYIMRACERRLGYLFKRAKAMEESRSIPGSIR